VGGPITVYWAVSDPAYTSDPEKASQDQATVYVAGGVYDTQTAIVASQADCVNSNDPDDPREPCPNIELQGWVVNWVGLTYSLGGSVEVPRGAYVNVSAFDIDGNPLQVELTWETCSLHSVSGMGEVEAQMEPTSGQAPGAGGGQLGCSATVIFGAGGGSGGTGSTGGGSAGFSLDPGFWGGQPSGGGGAGGGGLHLPAARYDFGLGQAGLVLAVQSLKEQSYSSAVLRVSREGKGFQTVVGAGAIQQLTGPPRVTYSTAYNGADGQTHYLRHYEFDGMLAVRDVNPSDGFFEIDYYGRAAVLGDDTHPEAFSGLPIGTPSVIWRIENPDHNRGEYHQVRITQMDGQRHRTGTTVFTKSDGAATQASEWLMQVLTVDAGNIEHLVSESSLSLSATDGSLVKVDATYSALTGAILEKTGKIWIYGFDPDTGLMLEGKGIRRYLADGTFVTSLQKVYDVESPQPLSGRVAYEEDEDGKTRRYNYESGALENGVFTPGVAVGAYALHTTILHGIPDPVALLTTREEQYFTAEGRLAIDEEHVYAPAEGDTLLTRTTHQYDSNGNLTASYRNGRQIYGATYAGERKVAEADARGVTRVFSNFDIRGNPGTVTRNALPGLPAQITYYEYDGSDRVVFERRTAAGCVDRTTRREYDYQGRLLSERDQEEDGLKKSYSYVETPSGLTVTKTGLGGTEVRVTDIDGRLTSVSLKDPSNDAVVSMESHEFGYDANSQLEWEKVTRGSGEGAPWTCTTRDMLGRIVMAESPLPDGTTVKRTFSYGSSGALIEERINGQTVRSSVETTRGSWTTTVNPAPDPVRTETRSRGFVKDGSSWYRLTTHTRGTYLDKVGGFTVNQIAQTIATDVNGNETRITTTVDPDGVTMIQTTVRTGIENHAQTKTRGGVMISETTHSVQAPTTYDYDGFGRAKTILRPLGAFEGAQRYQTTTISYDDIFSEPKTVTAGAQTITNDYYSEEHSSAGRLKAQTVNGRTTRYGYDLAGRLTHVWGDASYPLKYGYDLAGRLTSLRTYREEASWDAESLPAAFGNAAKGDLTQWVYHFGTDLLKQKLDAANQGPEYDYDAEGRLRIRKWVRNVSTTYSYNRLGELTGITYDDGTPAVRLTRDTNGRLAAVADAAGSRTFAYTGGWLTGETGAGNVQWNYDNDAVGRRTAYSLSIAGQAVTQGGRAYDPATGRLSGAGDAAGSGWATYSYLPGSDWLSTTTLGGMVTTRAPNADNRLLTIQTAVGGTTVSRFAYVYNNGQRSEASLPDGKNWKFEYNARGEVTVGRKVLPDDTVASGMHFQYGFDAIGNRTDAKETERETVYTTNALNQYLTRVVPGGVGVRGQADPATKVTVNGTSAQRQGSDYHVSLNVNNTAGPRWQAVKVVAAKAAASSEAGDELTEREVHVYVPERNETFQHDADGNLARDSRWLYRWDAENRLREMETRPQAIALGVPQQKLVFRYDAFNRRIAKDVYEANGDGNFPANPNRALSFYYEGWNLVAETSGATQEIVRTYLWGIDLSGKTQGAGGVGGLLVVRNHSAGASPPSFPSYDGNGNIVALVRSDLNGVAASYEYGPFGEPLRATGPMARANPFRFSTKYCDEETALCYYGYRFYDANKGRWVNRDPLTDSAFLSHLTASLQRGETRTLYAEGLKMPYAFALNSPPNRIDKKGLVAWIPIGVLGGACYTIYCEFASIHRYQDATKWAEGLTGTSAVNAGSDADALRHCVGACESMKIPLCINGIMEAAIQFREDSSEPEDRIDIHNNNVGFAAGRKGEDCKSACLIAHANDELAFADPQPQQYPNPP
jgi:RHS repeat-associated protein